MTEQQIVRLLKYLFRLAPKHFEAAIRPASEKELRSLESLSGRPIVGFHREFLLAMGNTPSGALDPFAVHCHFSIAELKHAYGFFEADQVNLPAEISLFSAAEAYDHCLFTRPRPDDGRQEIGTANVETGEFFPDSTGSLENFLLKSAFFFRMAQLDHIQSFESTAEWDPQTCATLFERKDFKPVFTFPDGLVCYEGGSFAARLYDDGSGSVASDDKRALTLLCELMEDNAPVKLRPNPVDPAPKC